MKYDVKVIQFCTLSLYYSKIDDIIISFFLSDRLCVVILTFD